MELRERGGADRELELQGLHAGPAKALRSAIFHAPGRLVRRSRRRIVRIIDSWPATALLEAHRRIELII